MLRSRLLLLPVICVVYSGCPHDLPGGGGPQFQLEDIPPQDLKADPTGPPATQPTCAEAEACTFDSDCGNLPCSQEVSCEDGCRVRGFAAAATP